MRSRSALFRGALLNTILRNDTFYFSQLGTFLERADNTARILDVKYYVLLPQIEMVGGGVDNVQWGAILRSVSAHRSYRWVYKENYKPWRIADYLILNRRCRARCAPATMRSRRRSTTSPSLYGDRLRLPRHRRRRRDELLAEGDMSGSSSPGCTSSSRSSSPRNNRLGSEIAEAYHFND